LIKRATAGWGGERNCAMAGVGKLKVVDAERVAKSAVEKMRQE
jgi:hypothetical protein